MELDAVIRAFADEGCPPPAAGASEAEMATWLDQVLTPDIPMEREP